MEKGNERNFALDLLRVAACFLVIVQHASEYFYIGDSGSVVTGDNTFWVGIMTSYGRISVPLFVMISGFFLLPMKDSTSTFFKKRFTRVLYPFIIWCIVYAVYFVFHRNDSWLQVGLNILQIPVNFGTQVGHLWYIYMLIGLYLLVPILSPWLKSCSRNELRGYLLLWGVTTFLPYIHLIFPEVLGECFWNSSPLLYYFTGFSGYLILGHYIKRYGALSVLTAIPLLLVSYGVTAYIFCSRIDTVALVPDLELSWGFCTVNVMLMAWATFSLFVRYKGMGSGVTGYFLTDISEKSYGMYLAHIIMLNVFYGLFGSLQLSTLIMVPLIAVCTFISVYLLIKALSYLPGSKYIIG